MRAPRCYCSLETKLYCSLVLFQLAMGEGWGSKIPCISTNLDIENMMNQLNQQSSLNYVLTKRTMCVAIMSFSLDWLSWRAGVQAVRPPREDFGRLPSGTHWKTTKPYITFNASLLSNNIFPTFILHTTLNNFDFWMLVYRWKTLKRLTSSRSNIWIRLPTIFICGGIGLRPTIRWSYFVESFLAICN